MTQLRLFTDGAARGNPGPAGIGVYIEDLQGNKVGEISEYIGEATNNVAEYRALLSGLAEAVKLQATNVEVFADSELMIKQMTGKYKVKNEGLIPLYGQAKVLERKIGSCNFTHVPRERNKLADRLANEGIDNKDNANKATANKATANITNANKTDVNKATVKQAGTTSTKGQEANGNEGLFKNLFPEVHCEILATGEKMQIVKFHMKKGMVSASQQQVQEQAVYIVSGKLKYVMGNKEVILEKGEGAIIPGGVEHEVHVLDDTISVNTFVPAKDDING